MSSFEEALNQRYVRKISSVVASDEDVDKKERKISDLQKELLRMKKEGTSDEAKKRMHERIMKEAKKLKQLRDIMKSK